LTQPQAAAKLEGIQERLTSSLLRRREELKATVDAASQSPAGGCGCVALHRARIVVWVVLGPRLSVGGSIAVVAGWFEEPRAAAAGVAAGGGFFNTTKYDSPKLNDKP